MAVGILLVIVGVWLVLRLFRAGLAGQLLKGVGVG